MWVGWCYAFRRLVYWKNADFNCDYDVADERIMLGVKMELNKIFFHKFISTTLGPINDENLKFLSVTDFVGENEIN